MFIKNYFLPILFGLITVVFVSCDKDYNELGADIVGDDHFGFEKYTEASIKAYNHKLGPIASNNLPVNPLGFYDNPAFGTTQANFVTQVEMATPNPTFNNTDPDEYDIEPTKIDSVILNIPYFSTVTKTISGKSKEYELDSIYGVAESKFKLSVYRSNYYLRDLDPGASLGEAQAFYTDQDGDIDGNKISGELNNAANPDENNQFYFDKRQHLTKIFDTDGKITDSTYAGQSMRFHLDEAVFDELILNAPSGQLENNAVFKNYFRGLYFKAESTGNSGNMAMLNFKGGKITIYYNEDKKKTVNGVDSYTRENKTFVLNLNGNTISLLNNSNENTDYLNAINNPEQEASKLYLKGGEGSITSIDLFGAADLYSYEIKKENDKPVDENGAIIPLDQNGNPVNGYLVYEKKDLPNGVSDELDDLRYPEYLEKNGLIYYSEKNRWMVNDASLTFFIDKTTMSDNQAAEPNRIFLYDLTNKKVLLDYITDFSTNNAKPKYSKHIHGGIIQQKDTIIKGGKWTIDRIGIKYKIKITNHVRDLIKNGSKNVRLGLSVTESITNVGFSKLKTTNSYFDSAPTMSVMNPLGTVLYGTNLPVDDPNRLKLEIYYTKPN